MAATPPVPTGTVRPADEMEGIEGAPPSKKVKVARLPGGQYYPEQNWIDLHPVRLLPIGPVEVILSTFYL
jgi:splicing factor 3A subunit 1